MRGALITIIFLFGLQCLHAQNSNPDSMELSMTNFPSRDSLELLLKEKKDDISKVNLLGALSWYYCFNKPDTGLDYGQKGVQLSQKLGYKWGISYCTQSLAFNLWALGNYGSSLKLTLDALHQFEDLKDDERVGYSYLILANIYRDIGDYKKALIEAQKGTKIYESIPVSGRIGYAIMGSIYELQNEMGSALFYVQKAHELDLKTARGKWNWPYTLLGNIQAKMKHYDTAFSYYQKALLLAIENNIPKDIVDIYNRIASLYKETGKPDSCIFYAGEVLQKWSFIAYQKGKLEAANTLANVYKAKNQQDSAIKYLELSVGLNSKLFSQEKEREIQNMTFNEQLREQEQAQQQKEFQNTIKLYSLLAALIVFLLIAFLLYRNNQHKQKANALLQQQKEKVESTLQELRSTQAQLIQSEKMASLGELTAGIAHEIQNPLNFVNNFSEVNGELIKELRNEVMNGNMDEVNAIANDIESNSEKINHHGKRADAIVKGMLQHSQSSTGVKEPTDINALADEFLQLSYHGLRAKDKSFNSELKTDFDETIGKINIIPQEIGRVLLNLYNNAFYATNERKKTAGEEYKPLVTVQTKKLNGKLEIKVSDNGNGIPQNIIDKIFQPFFTTKPTGQGTGLGLSLSYDIIKAHGGEIKVNTATSSGTEFIITLPV